MVHYLYNVVMDYRGVYKKTEKMHGSFGVDDIVIMGEAKIPGGLILPHPKKKKCNAKMNFQKRQIKKF